MYMSIFCVVVSCVPYFFCIVDAGSVPPSRSAPLSSHSQILPWVSRPLPCSSTPRPTPHARIRLLAINGSPRSDGAGLECLGACSSVTEGSVPVVCLRWGGTAG
ncbi:hypothetical protein C8R45DRAFT_384838 [Mycena sanguinolenta]|nr:hypothetical protein C8R45DRAFT_384838 [Mycena sanguinolenta]